MHYLLPATRIAGRRIANTGARNTLFRAAAVSQQPLRIIASSSFHNSSYRQSEQPKSPFQTFVDVLQEEIKKNRQLQENVLSLKGDVDKLQDSEALKRAKDMYERARVE